MQARDFAGNGGEAVEGLWRQRPKLAYAASAVRPGARSSRPDQAQAAGSRLAQLVRLIDRRATLILDRNLFHVVDNHSVARTFLRIQLQTELILDGLLKRRARIGLRHGRSAIRRHGSRG